MASIKYSIQSKSDSASIYMRLSLSKSNYLKCRIGLFIDSAQWSTSKGLPKQTTSENKKLSSKLQKLKTDILDKVNEINSNPDIISKEWLLEKIDNHFERNQIVENDYLVDYGNQFVKDLDYKVGSDNKRGASISTKKKYKTIVNKLKTFEKKKKKRYLIKDVDLTFHRHFMKFLSDDQKLSDNTVGRYLKVVKSICLDAQRNGKQVSIQLSHFKGFTVKSPKITLSFEELEILKEKEFSNEKHEIARDWLIIGCYSGQRVSDLMRMNKEMIQPIGNYRFIVLNQKKTDKLVQIPIHYEAELILEKYQGNFPPLFNSNMEINNVLFNKYLKEVCKLAEISEMVQGNKHDKETGRYQSGLHHKYSLISSHVCRRSFATNFYAKRKYPTPLLMNITGHSTEKMFLEYIGKKPIDYGLQLAEIWAKEATKGDDNLKMEIV